MLEALLNYILFRYIHWIINNPSLSKKNQWGGMTKKALYVDYEKSGRGCRPTFIIFRLQYCDIMKMLVHSIG